MTTDSRNLVKVLSVITVVVVGLSVAASFAAAVVVYRAGMIVVNVSEKRPGGSKVHVIVPGILASLGMALVPHVELGKCSAHAAPFLPALDAAARELVRCDDGLFVDVEAHDAHVTITKSNGSLLIDVDDADATLHLSVPLQALTAVTSVLRSSIKVV